ncbi:DMT family transporter [Pseudomonas sp. NA-150]|uniref:DMT family transporter n=1 Tax=Pseudomonas sp. NA-150 TaxID=3367525 RepID=UPI0037CA25C4
MTVAFVGLFTKSSSSTRRLGLMCGLFAALVWGAFLAVSRAGITSGLSAADLTFLRFTTAGLLMLPWFLRHSPLTLAGIGKGRGVILAILAGPPFVMIGASGYAFAPLAHGAVLQPGALTLMSFVLASWLLNERSKPRQLVGLAIVVIGLSVIAGPGLLAGGSQAPIGDMLFVLAGSMWALFSVLARRWHVAPVAATAVVSVLSALLYSPVYLLTRGLDFMDKVSPAMLIEQVVVQGVLSGVLALFAYSIAVRTLGAARSAIFPALAPAAAILIGIPLVGEIPTELQWLGLAVVSSGLIIVVTSKQ